VRAPPLRYGAALVVGKLCPLHLGHLWLIERALAESDRVYVLTYTSLQAPGCEAAARQRWLDALLAPYGERALGVVISPESCPPDEADAESHRLFCAGIALERGWALDAVFTSETYGDGFAVTLARVLGRGVSHVCVDLARARVPVSGTELRAALALLLRDPLSPEGRGALERLRGGLPGVVFEDIIGARLLLSPLKT
jgi:HTH-type transcriptional repressor of NAD biosynthesis genes